MQFLYTWPYWLMLTTLETEGRFWIYIFLAFIIFTATTVEAKESDKRETQLLYELNSWVIWANQVLSGFFSQVKQEMHHLLRSVSMSVYLPGSKSLKQHTATSMK